MKAHDPMVFQAVFQAMLGPMLWVMLLPALATVVAFVSLVMHERAIVSRRLLLAERPDLHVGVVASVILAQVSSCALTEMGGPADRFLIARACGVGAVATPILSHAVMGRMKPRRRQRSAAAALHAQIKRFHEGQALGRVEPVERKPNPQAFHDQQCDAPLRQWLPSESERTVANVHHDAVALVPPSVFPDRARHPAQPLRLAAAHVTLKTLCVV